MNVLFALFGLFILGAINLSAMVMSIIALTAEKRVLGQVVVFEWIGYILTACLFAPVIFSCGDGLLPMMFVLVGCSEILWFVLGSIAAVNRTCTYILTNHTVVYKISAGGMGHKLFVDGMLVASQTRIFIAYGSINGNLDGIPFCVRYGFGFFGSVTATYGGQPLWETKR